MIPLYVLPAPCGWADLLAGALVGGLLVALGAVLAWVASRA